MTTFPIVLAPRAQRAKLCQSMFDRVDMASFNGRFKERDEHQVLAWATKIAIRHRVSWYEDHWREIRFV